MLRKVEDTFKQTNGNERLHEISSDGVSIANFVKSKNCIVTHWMNWHRNIHKYIWTSNGKTDQ
jgi:hypothetical protein